MAIKKFLLHANIAADNALVANEMYFVGGKTTLRDAGRGWFELDTADTTTAASNDVIVPSGSVTGRYKKVQESVTFGARSSTSFTRPSNTTAYTAGDVWGATAAAITLAGVGLSGRIVNLSTLALMVEASAVPSGIGNIRAHLYDVTPPSALADNAVWDLSSGDRNAYLGFVDLGVPQDLGSTLYCKAMPMEPIKLASEDLFVYLVTDNGWTPTSALVGRLIGTSSIPA